MKLTDARLRALRYARDDVVLLVKRRDCRWGSSDVRLDVRYATARELLDAGLLKLNIAHGDDTAVGFELTEAGVSALAKSPSPQ